MMKIHVHADPFHFFVAGRVAAEKEQKTQRFLGEKQPSLSTRSDRKTTGGGKGK